ncbi:PhnA domain-containing protein [Streptomyces sp. NBC_01343]|nr:PhnA domain-containing protein [Streptomyces sp. NBC_01343]
MSDITLTDSNGTVLEDGDSVTLLKDLKVKGPVLKTEFLKKA